MSCGLEVAAERARGIGGERANVSPFPLPLLATDFPPPACSCILLASKQSLTTDTFALEQDMEHRAPWWLFGYYGSPTAYSLWGLVASQLGDVQHEFLINSAGSRVSVADFVRAYFGFRHDFLGWTVLLLIAFVVAFRLIAIWALAYLNFQKR